MDTPNQLLVGGQITDALSLAIQVLQMQIGVLQRAKASLDGGSSVDDVPDTSRRRSSRGEAKKRSPARKLEDQAIIDYFKQQPRSIKTMAADLNVTLTYAHKRVKELMKSLKKVKEGTSVLYMVKPRRNAAKDKASGKGSKAAASN